MLFKQIQYTFRLRNYYNLVQKYQNVYSSATYSGSNYLTLSNRFHISHNAKTKIFPETENKYAYYILQRTAFEPNLVKNSENEISTTESFNKVLDQDWRNSNATEIASVFASVKKFCIDNNINLSDPRFNKLVDGLMDHCEKLTDNELLSILTSLCEYPLCESYSSHNFHDVWSCLDDICCWKMSDWDVNKMLLFAAVWYRLNLGRLCDFIFKVLDRLTKRAEKLTKDQLVSVYFYFNICRGRPVDFEYEYALEQLIKDLDVDEMAVVAMGYFKTKSSIKLTTIMQEMIEKVQNNSKIIHEISLTAILKIIRFSKPTKLVKEINLMLDSLYPEMDRLSNLCCIHIALLSTGVQNYHKNTLKKASQRIVNDIADIEKVRIKDIERLLNVLSMFNYDPQTNPDVFKTAFDEIHKNERIAEFVKYPRCLTCTLNYLSLRNIYSYELMNTVLDPEYILSTFGKVAKFIPRELLSLDASIDIECPGYSGNRLSSTLKYKIVKYNTEFTPTHDQKKKINAAEKLVLETIDTVKAIVKDDKFMYIDHVLPHYPRADIILCKDKTTGSFIQPSGFEKYTLGDVMVPENDGTLQWYAIIVLGWNNTIRDSSLPLGLMKMKERQLNKIGYKPVKVIWNEFLKLTPEGKIQYISRNIL